MILKEGMTLKIGTRGSALALAQTQLVEDALTCETEALTVKTLGDRRQETDKAKVADKKEWILELERALLSSDISLAIHSAKDVPINIEPGTELLPVLSRATALDAFIPNPTRDWEKFTDLPENACIGTSSLRRIAQLLCHQADYKIIPCRGNVPTRIKKLIESSELDGIVVAAAGLERLEIADLPYETLTAEKIVPAANQGILAAQFRSDDKATRELLEPLICPQTLACFQAERTCIKALGADCHSAIGTYATAEGASIRLTVRVLSHNGDSILEITEEGSPATGVGEWVAEALLTRGVKSLL